jgi:hypothetical protein
MNKRKKLTNSPKKSSTKKLTENKDFDLNLNFLSEDIYNQLNNNCLSSKNQTSLNYNVSQLSQQMQLKFLQTKILLINLTSCITELAKLLVTAGFNIYT